MKLKSIVESILFEVIEDELYAELQKDILSFGAITSTTREKFEINNIRIPSILVSQWTKQYKEKFNKSKDESSENIIADIFKNDKNHELQKYHDIENNERYSNQYNIFIKIPSNANILKNCNNTTQVKNKIEVILGHESNKRTWSIDVYFHGDIYIVYVKSKTK